MRKLLVQILSTIFLASQAMAQDVSITKTSQRYLGADLYFSQTLGSGAIAKNLSQDKSNSSGLTLYPTLVSPKFWGDRYLKASLEFNTSYDWAPSEDPKATKQLDFTDVKFRLQLKNAVKFADWGLSFTPGFKMEIPTSSASTIANRMVGLGTNLSFAGSWGGFSLAYKPTAVGYIHSSPYKSGACAPDSPDASRLPNGQCIVEGRQTMVMVKNGVFASYTLGDHGLTLGMRTYHNFLRAPSKESGDKPAGQTYNEATLGILEYAYTVPVKLPITLALGITSYNGAYDPSTGFKVPFFSTNPAASNFSSVYFAVDMTL